MRHGHDLDDWLDAGKIAMENRDGHAKEIKQEVNVVRNQLRGFVGLLKKKGFIRKVERRQLEGRLTANSGSPRHR
jgi:predicted transcriptional regulator of viral defense system